MDYLSQDMRSEEREQALVANVIAFATSSAGLDCRMNNS